MTITLYDILMSLVVVVAALPVLGVWWLVCRFLSAPMRRRMREQVVVQLITQAVQDGREPGALVALMSGRADRFMGKRFDEVGYFVANGFTVADALRQVPGFVSEQLTAKLDVGLRTGNMTRVLPGCRRATRPVQSYMRRIFCHLLLIGFIGLPIYGFVLLILAEVTDPRDAVIYEVLAYEVAVGSPVITLLKMLCGSVLGWIYLGLAVILFGCVVMYGIGLWCANSVYPEYKYAGDWILYQVRWRRLGCLRDFVEMLTVLLDAGVPESEAVDMAGACTGNRIFESEAECIRQDLGKGVPLIRALGRFDFSGDLPWWLENAARAEGGLAGALAGWGEGLSAQASQLEQESAQRVATAVVIFLGCLMVLTVLACFGVLIEMVEGESSW